MSRIIIKAPNINFNSENKKSIGVPHKSQFQGEDFVDEDKERDQSDEINNLLLNASKECDSIIEDAKNKAASIIERAQAEAKEIINSAKQSAETESVKIKKQAHDDGYNSGYKEGTVKSNKLIKDAQNELNNAKLEREKILKNIEPEMVELIIKICHKLLSDSLIINPNVISFLIKIGLEQVVVVEDIVIHVSPDDYKNTVESKQTIQSYIKGAPGMKIIKDFSLTKGDCIIETPLGNIDSSLNGQLSLLEQDLYTILENR